MRVVQTLCLSASLAISLCHGVVHARPAEELIVTARPTQDLTGKASQRLSRQDLLTLPYPRLDDALAAGSTFSLFRRTPSLVANPTTQGATLRGIGPNGAGRAAVFLDGAPLNDPFGNWVNWSALPPLLVSGVSVTPGALPVSAGPGALSGAIAIETGQTTDGLAMSFEGNTLPGLDASLVYGAKTRSGLDVIAFASGGQRDGYILLPESQRGPVDVPTASYNASGGLKLGLDMGRAWRTSLSVRGFSEGRDNGVLGARNSTEGFDGAIRAQREDANAQSDVVIWGQLRRFESLFTATNDTRTTARAVLDQFSVPSFAAGVRANHRQRWSRVHETQVFLQADVRRGETNEQFRNLGQGFTRVRAAGGRQRTFGLGLAHAVRLSDTLSATGGLRIDHLSLSGGFRTERDLASNAILRADVFESRGETILGGHAELAFQPAPAWRLSVRGYSGARQPSLNEYFRPFRVGNDITEANPALDIERLHGLDVQVRFEPLAGQFAEITAFRNWVVDAVGNISVPGASGGFIAPCGFVPSGGSCRQRGNVERVRVRGVTLRFSAGPREGFSVSGFYGFTDSDVARADAAPQLEGLRVAQVARHQGSVRLAYQGLAPSRQRWTTQIIVRGQTAQFEDDLNLRALDGFMALDASVRWPLGRGVRARLDGQNLTNSLIEAGRSGDGLITRGQPLTVRFGIDVAL